MLVALSEVEVAGVLFTGSVVLRELQNSTRQE